VTYECLECGEPTEKGGLVVFSGGQTVIVALCPEHMNKLRRQMVSQGVRVEESGRMN